MVGPLFASEEIYKYLNDSNDDDNIQNRYGTTQSPRLLYTKTG